MGTSADNKQASSSAPIASETREIANFIEEMSGGLVSNALGLVADKLAYLSLKQAFSLRDKVREELRRRGVQQPREVFPKILLPLLENATIEEDEQLHSRYAMMLANARDPNFHGKVTRSFATILSELEPLDVFIIEMSFTALSSNHREALADLRLVCKSTKESADNVAISVRNLIRLGLLKPGVVIADGVMFGNHKLASYKDIDLFGITELGIAFVKAMRPPSAPAN